jgi:hypothetical protein
VRVKNLLAFYGTCRYYPSGPVNHFVKGCLLRWGIDSPPLASKNRRVVGCSRSHAHCIQNCLSYLEAKIFRTWSTHQEFRYWTKQCVVTLVQGCALGPFGRGLYSTEDEVLVVCAVEQWSRAQEYKFEKWCSMSAIYGGRVYFLYRKSVQCSYWLL